MVITKMVASGKSVNRLNNRTIAAGYPSSEPHPFLVLVSLLLIFVWRMIRPKGIVRARGR